MPAIDTTIGDISYVAPRSRVYVADALREADFVEVDYLHCDKLTLESAPGFDQALIRYEFGKILREDQTSFTAYLPKEIIGKYVKVVIADTEYYAADDITWYGVILAESKDTLGVQDSTPTGFQTYVAYGVLVMLDREPVRTSRVANAAEDALLTIKRGLPFNFDQGGIFVRRGNRSSAEVSGTYVFANESRTLNEWTAYEACRYLLKYHGPKDAAGATCNEVEFNNPTTAQGVLSWYDISLQTDGYTTKQILDSLIDRRRAVGYYATFDPADDKIKIHVFSFVDANITLPSGATLTANADAYTLDFDQALDVDEATVNNLETTRYHTVIARGARRTSTFTTRILSPSENAAIIPDWTSAEELAYLRGASNESGYNSLSTIEQGSRNALFRSDEKFRNVFCRYIINRDWNGTLIDWHGDDATEFLWSPEIGDSDETIYSDASYALDETVWLPGCRILRSLPFLDRYDYTGNKISETTYGAGFTDVEQPEFIPPFAYTEVDTYSGYWLQLDKLNIDPNHETYGRGWAAGLSIIDTTPAIQFNVPFNQLLATLDWDSYETAETLPEHDPNDLANGINWGDVYVTLCVEQDQQIEAVRTISAPSANAQDGRLLIEVPDARFDWVVPKTTVAIRDGMPVVTDTGGAVRDDRARLEDIARAAAEWYGRPRQTLRLVYRQVRDIFSLGWLITSIGEYHSLEDINTVITSIEYDLGGPHRPGSPTTPRTTIQTSFAELDVT